MAKNAGDKDKLRENLKAIIPHQFGDHSLCHPNFCGQLRTDDTYVHKGLPYKAVLKDDRLRVELEKIFTPLANNAEQFADLGSSQACEHANREMALRAPKSLHYGNTKSLDYRVHATAACINEGRKYIPQVRTSSDCFVCELHPFLHLNQMTCHSGYMVCCAFDIDTV